MIDLLAIFLAITGLTVIGLAWLIISEECKLLRQIRKVAAMYPPYMPAETDMEALDQTSVKLDNDWTDLGPGRD